MNEQSSLVVDPASIEKSLVATLQDIGELFEKSPSEGLKCADGKTMSFADGHDNAGIINTAEALECFLIPYFAVKGIREKFWSGELIDLDHLKSAIKYLLEDYLDDPADDGELGLSGTPYMDFRLKGTSKAPSKIQRNLDFLDSGCFVLSSLLDAKAANAERAFMISEKILPPSTPELIPDYLVEKLNRRITDATRLILECDLGAGKGWAYTNDRLEKDKQDQLYFTWNALETLDTFQDYLESAPGLFPSETIDLLGGDKFAVEFMKRKMYEKRSYLAATFLSQDNPTMNICKQKVDFGSEDSIWYYNLFAIISLLITDSTDSKSLNSAFRLLLLELRDEKTYSRVNKPEYGRFPIAGSLQNEHEKWWEERAISALVIKALAFHERRNRKAFEQLLQELDIKRAEDIYGLYLNNLAEDRLIIGDVSYNVWDKKKSEYSIYYTERAIEAVVKLYGSHYTNRKVDQYYGKKSAPPLLESANATASTSNISIHIDGELVAESVILKAQGSVQDKIKELLNSDFLTNAIREKLDERMDDSLDLQIRSHLGYILSNYTSDSPDKKYKPSVDYLEKFVLEVLSKNTMKILENYIAEFAAKKGRRVDGEDFVRRFGEGARYLLEWELREDGAIDYAKTFYQMEQSNIIQFVSNGNAPSKKKK